MSDQSKGKKTASKKTARKSSSAGRESSTRPWMILGAAVLLIGAYFYFVNQSKDQKENEPNIPKHTLETTGAGANADFTDKTKQIHYVVDQLLKENQATVLDTKQVDKAVNRQNAEGQIKWNARTLPVAIPAAKLDFFKTEVKRVLAKIDAEVLVIEPDQYEGKAALRMDLGIRDTLDGDVLTIIADKLYLFEKQVGIIEKSPPPSTAVKRPVKAKLALIIDDFGYAKEPIRAYARIHAPLTFAILPNHPYSTEAANEGAKNGQQIILHLPMEAMSDQAKVEENTIDVAMNRGEITAMVNELTDSVPHLVGVNNHQGSKATSNRRVMKTVMNTLANKGLFFVDSKTLGTSVAYDVAREEGVPAAENMLFIDNNNEVAAIKEQLRKAGDLALSHGKAIAIGHARVNTAVAIEQMLSDFSARGIQLVFVSSILE